jgi:hypothetical protein
VGWSQSSSIKRLQGCYYHCTYVPSIGLLHTVWADLLLGGGGFLWNIRLREYGAACRATAIYEAIYGFMWRVRSPKQPARHVFSTTLVYSTTRGKRGKTKKKKKKNKKKTSCIGREEVKAKGTYTPLPWKRMACSLLQPMPDWSLLDRARALELDAFFLFFFPLSLFSIKPKSAGYTHQDDVESFGSQWKGTGAEPARDEICTVAALWAALSVLNYCCGPNVVEKYTVLLRGAFWEFDLLLVEVEWQFGTSRSNSCWISPWAARDL